jgi:hypothetical protein
MHRVGQHDINDIDVGIVSDLIEVIAARRQSFVFCRPGAIWLVLRLPRPTRAKPSFLFSCAIIRAAVTGKMLTQATPREMP